MLHNAEIVYLQKLILFKAGITNLLPSDCKRISVIISKEQHAQISETTIKRFFGLAKSSHAFSKFTLNILCQFTGFENWENFLIKIKEKPTLKHLNKWEEYRYKCKLVSNITLRTVKNKSGIPYLYTVKRTSSLRDCKYFYQSEFSFSALVAQPYHGKSILLSHLVEDLFLKEDAVFEKDIILFINPNTFLQHDSFSDFSENHAFQLSNDALKLNFIQHFEEHPTEIKGKAVIIFDGFDHSNLNKDQLHKTLDHIVNFIYANENNKWLKVVLGMHSTTWRMFYEKIKDTILFSEKFYSGPALDCIELINVPPFTNNEIETFLNNIHENPPHLNVDHQLSTLLRFPIFLQLYYQLQQTNREFNYENKSTFNELISLYVHKKIETYSNFTETILLLKTIVHQSQFGKFGRYVTKESILAHINKFKEAYLQLLNSGVLIEEKDADGILPVEIIRFYHPAVFDYFIFVELLEKFDRKIDTPILQEICDSYRNCPLTKLNLLQWAIRYAVINFENEILDLLLKLPLDLREQSQLIGYMASVRHFKRRFQVNEKLNNIHHYNYIRHLVHFEFTDLSYNELIKGLLSMAKGDKTKLIYSSLLSFHHIIKLDLEALDKDLISLSALQQHADDWLINPYEGVLLIQSCLRSKPIHDHPLLKKIDKFKNSPEQFNYSDAQMSPERIISYRLIIFINFFYGHIVNNIKIVKAVGYHHPHLFNTKSTLAIFLMNLKVITEIVTQAEVNFKNQIELLLRVKKEKKHKQEFDSTYLEISLMEILHNIKQGPVELLFKQIEECLAIAKQKKLNLYYSHFLNLKVGVCTYHKYREEQKEAEFNLYCFLEKLNISENAFPNYRRTNSSGHGILE